MSEPRPLSAAEGLLSRLKAMTAEYADTLTDQDQDDITGVVALVRELEAEVARLRAADAAFREKSASYSTYPPSAPESSSTTPPDDWRWRLESPRRVCARCNGTGRVA
jgi:hypothetical protein